VSSNSSLAISGTDFDDVSGIAPRRYCSVTTESRF
jgi:hypothetical protein